MDEQKDIKILRAAGKTADEAEKILLDSFETYKSKYALDLDAAPKKEYEIYFFDGPKLGNAALQSKGASYEEALGFAYKTFKDDLLKDKNQEVRITASYLLSEKDQKAIAKGPRITAGPKTSESKSLDNFL